MNQAIPNLPVQQFVLDFVTYGQYVALTDALGERAGLRASFDGQRLELMTLSRGHHRLKSILGSLVGLFTLDLGMPLESGGSMTVRNALAECGLEPDECFWIQNAVSMIGVADWDAAIHPAPDLVIEIQVDRAAVDRAQIHSRLGVPEVWRFDGGHLSSSRLAPDGQYQLTARSVAFPFLDVTMLERFVVGTSGALESEILRQFREWIATQNFPRTNRS